MAIRGAKTIRDLIYHEYGKIIARRAGKEQCKILPMVFEGFKVVNATL